MARQNFHFTYLAIRRLVSRPFFLYHLTFSPFHENGQERIKSRVVALILFFYISQLIELLIVTKAMWTCYPFTWETGLHQHGVIQSF